MTKLNAIKELVHFDHSFMTPEYAKKIAKSFGIKPRITKQFDQRSLFKGLTLFGINPVTKKEFKEGDYAEGVAAHLLACDIADSLGVEYKVMHRIGSQLRSACEAVRKHLEK